MYPRTSAIEANQVVNLVGGPYVTKNYRARARVVFQNKNVMCQYRAVGHPIACSVTEGLVDLAAAKIGMDPVEIRRRNLIADDAYPCASPSGLRFELLSHHAAMNKLMTMMDYDALRAEQATLRSKSIHRGIGIASFIEVTNPSAAFYGVGGARISSQDGVAVRLDAQGSVICQTSITEQGQGSESLTAQIVGSVLGVSMERVRVILGDTDNTPYGGGTWASRGAGIGGEAALQAAKILRRNILDVAAAILQSSPAELDIADNAIVNAERRRAAHRAARAGADRLFPSRHLPPGIQPELMATRHFVPREYPFAFTNGVQASWLEVDTDTGFVKLLRHWVVEDCGTHHQSATGRRADPGRRGAGPRRGAVREMHLRRARPTDQRQYGRLSGADVRRNARHRRRPCGVADVGDGAGRQGRGRGRYGRGSGGGGQRGERCAQAVRRCDHRDSADAAGYPDGAGANLNARGGLHRSGRDRLAIDVLGREHAVPEGIALDAALFSLFAAGSHGFADAKGHEGHLAGMMVGDLVETLR